MAATNDHCLTVTCAPSGLDAAKALAFPIIRSITQDGSVHVDHGANLPCPMLLRKLWPLVRRLVPVSCYPLLAVAYRWDARRTIRQLERDDAAYRESHLGVVAPGAKLRFKVTGPCSADAFLKAGLKSVECLEAALRFAGTSFDAQHTVLDWGCGCGRTLQALCTQYPHLAVTGADVDAEAISWCQTNLHGLRVDATAGLPPLPYPDGAFDIVYALSVFTHIDADRQDRWLTELRRVLRPGGILLATVHGPQSWEGLPAATVDRIQSEGMVFANTSADKWLHPDWYQTTWHTEAYVRRHWSQSLEITGYLTNGMIFELSENAQIIHDLVVLRCPSPTH